jgi:hypothetical protein
MNTAESEALTPYISRLTEDTKAGKLKWVKSNPTTFIWRKTTRTPYGAQLSIQKISQTRMTRSTAGQLIRQMIDNYIFQASELPSGDLKLVVNATDKGPEVKHALKVLYDSITADVDREGLDFLKKIIED